MKQKSILKDKIITTGTLKSFILFLTTEINKKRLQVYLKKWINRYENQTGGEGGQFTGEGKKEKAWRESKLGLTID